MLAQPFLLLYCLGLGSLWGHPKKGEALSLSLYLRDLVYVSCLSYVPYVSNFLSRLKKFVYL